MNDEPVHYRKLRPQEMAGYETLVLSADSLNHFDYTGS